VGKAALAQGYKLSGGHFLDDIAVWAEATGRSESDVIGGNISYELAQAGAYLADRFWGLFGCTAVVLKVPGFGMVHVRNLDWSLEEMGRTTIIVRLKKRGREVVTVTNPGLVGVLSGMVPGKFSITLNWAPPLGWLGNSKVESLPTPYVSSAHLPR
jgi:hypothetical protein